MSIRCAACGSKRVMASDKKEGYSLAKGAAGAILLGPVGAIAGVGGKSNTYYHCLECGQVLPYPMYQWLSDNIDRYLAEPQLWGGMLDSYKKEYVNLEWEIKSETPKASPEDELTREEIIDNIKDAILIYLRNIGTVAEYEQLSEKFTDKNRDFGGSEFQDALISLWNSGRIKREFIGEVVYFRLLTDIDEIRECQLERKAFYESQSFVNENYNELECEVLNSVEIGKQYTSDEYKSVLILTINNRIKSDNPYLCDYAVDWLTGKLKYNEILVEASDGLFVFNSKETAIALVEERERQEEAERVEEERRRQEEQQRAEEADEELLLNFFKENPNKKFNPGELQKEFSDEDFKASYSVYSVISRMEEKGLLEKDLEEINGNNFAFYTLAGQMEGIKKNPIYEKAQAKMDSANYTEAIELFNSIGGWKDADALCETCKAKLEERRLEKERQAELDRIVAEERAKKTKKIAMIVLPIAVLAIAIAIIVTTVIIPNSKYDDAVALMDAGKYKESYEAFIALDGYKDSAEKANAAKYEEALAYINENEYIAAHDILVGLDDYKDSADKAKSIHFKYNLEKMTEAKVGDYITFGSYEQDNNKKNGKEEIEWKVLEKSRNRILVISKYGLDYKKFNNKRVNVTWETCTLRKWLNNDFLLDAFSSDEKAMIPTVLVSADKNPEYSTNVGNSTSDKIFLLSIVEKKKYLADESACETTKYAEESDYTGASSWWLRTPGKNQNVCADVGFGGIYEHGLSVDVDYCVVRPAMWIELD